MEQELLRTVVESQGNPWFITRYVDYLEQKGYTERGKFLRHGVRGCPRWILKSLGVTEAFAGAAGELLFSMSEQQGRIYQAQLTAALAGSKPEICLRLLWESFSGGLLWDLHALGTGDMKSLVAVRKLYYLWPPEEEWALARAGVESVLELNTDADSGYHEALQDELAECRRREEEVEQRWRHVLGQPEQQEDDPYEAALTASALEIALAEYRDARRATDEAVRKIQLGNRPLPYYLVLRAAACVCDSFASPELFRREAGAAFVRHALRAITEQAARNALRANPEAVASAEIARAAFNGAWQAALSTYSARLLFVVETTGK